MFALVEPSVEYKDAFFKMVEDYKAANEDRYQKEATKISFETYIELLRDESKGMSARTLYLPMSTFWLIKDHQTIVGVTRLRHQLTPSLYVDGGHIGGDVPPSLRNRGYGTMMLRMTLDKAREMGLERVLMTCDSDNIPSIRNIEKNGGVLENKLMSPFTGKLIHRYWIDL